MDRDLPVPLLRLQVDLDLALARLQAPQLIAYRTGVAVTSCNEVQAAFYAARHRARPDEGLLTDAASLPV